MRFLVGQDNGKTWATITTSKEEADYQFQHSWSDEDDNKMVDTEPIKRYISPKIYDLRTHASSLVEVILDEEKTHAKLYLMKKYTCQVF